ncbi:porin family protein [Aquimarina brevivitae]|uniref:Outer membrane protein with beta-barrel domain n=1 Tax=Aquimarina brevivitae TaxID=323412 RepID=A0A4Q7P1Q1_9FLAO|nr:porin family protein [Aquimarina brevivitae]RZS93644.1 outer membrane protein with beta-barrel domain [Aquimarina brevivitae]
MKKLLILAVMLVGFTTVTTAQDIKLGFKGGVNFASLSGDDADGLDGRTGYHIGGVVQFSLAGMFAIQPEVIYSAQGAEFESFDLNVDYLNVPILAKLKFAKVFSVEAGPQFGFVVNEGDDVGDIESFDLSGALGAGVELGSFFGQVRYNFGLTDISSDADIKNSNFQISVGYYIF